MFVIGVWLLSKIVCELSEVVAVCKGDDGVCVCDGGEESYVIGNLRKLAFCISEAITTKWPVHRAKIVTAQQGSFL